MNSSAIKMFAPALNRKMTMLILLGALVLVMFPYTAVDAARFALHNLLLMLPIMLFAGGLTAAITASGATALIAAVFQGRELHMIFWAAFVGALTPVCGVSVLPLVAGLLAAGVPLAPIMAFWLSSPITDPAMLTITVATLGLPFAIGKTAAAFLIGIFGGISILIMVRSGYLQSPTKSSASLQHISNRSCDSSDCATINWRFWQERGRRQIFRDVVTNTLRLMLIWLSVAFVAEYFLKLYLPDTFLLPYVGRDSVWAVPLAATIGTPIYLDGYAALPLIRGLIDSGMRPDAAMAFIVAGGITSAWAAIPVFALVRLPVFAIYLALAVSGSMLAGWGFGFFLPFL